MQPKAQEPDLKPSCLSPPTCGPHSSSHFLCNLVKAGNPKLHFLPLQMEGANLQGLQERSVRRLVTKPSPCALKTKGALISPNKKNEKACDLNFVHRTNIAQQSLCCFSKYDLGSEPTDREGYLFLFGRSKILLWNSIKQTGGLRRPQHHGTPWALRVPSAVATAPSLGERFWNKSGNYLSDWSPKGLWARLAAKGKGISSECSTAVHRLQLLEGLASNGSKEPAAPMEVNFRLFFSRRWVFWLRLVLLFLCSSLRFGGVYWLGLTQGNLLWGGFWWTEERKQKASELALRGESWFWKQPLS